MNSVAKPAGSFLNNISKNATRATNSVTQSAVGAFNSLSSSTSTILGAANKAVNSGLNSFATAVNSAATTTVEALPTMNSLLPMNSSLGKNNSASNNFTNVLNNTTKNSGWNMSWLIYPISIFLLLVGIFLMFFIFYKEPISQAYQTAINWLRKTFQFSSHTPEPTEPPAPVLTQPPTPTDAAMNASTSIVDKVLPLSKKEVFNVSSNEYTYYDAEPLCRALGAELATYEQVKKSWESGADWCNYGWVKGQAAVFPTQQNTWDKLQNGPEDEKFACGTPGVNGGAFDNPEMRFGVNCYGVKPAESSNDEKNIMARGNFPKTPATLKVDQQIQEFKAHMGTIGVLPFSEATWGQS